MNEWLDLGTFTAKFVQGEQTFDLPDPAFARYVYVSTKLYPGVALFDAIAKEPDDTDNWSSGECGFLLLN